MKALLSSLVRLAHWLDRRNPEGVFSLDTGYWYADFVGKVERMVAS